MQQIEKQKRTVLKKGSKDLSPKNLPSDRSKIEISVMENSKKELDYMENKYMKLASRIEEIADPNYAIELAERIMVIEEKIKKGKKDKKLMETDEIPGRNKRANLQRDIERCKAYIAATQIKISEINKKIDENTNWLEAFHKKKNDSHTSFKELEKTAIQMGICTSSNRNADLLKQQEKKLRFKEENLMRELKMMKTKGIIARNEYNSKVNELNTAINGLANRIEKKNKYMFL